MKFVKRLTVILFISVFAVIAGSVKTDYSCDCGNSLSFPFSFIAKLFNSDDNIISHSHDHGLHAKLSLLAGAAYAQKKGANFIVTFIELGSVNCVPCKMMQPVIKRVEQKYGSQVKVIFHDVWTEKGAPFSRIYNVRAIPTQVYIDSNGKEFFRHEGFHPFEEVEKILKRAGVK